MNETQSRAQHSSAPELNSQRLKIRVKARSNPFYVLLVLLGIAFTVTACAYAVMAFRATKLDRGSAGAQQPNGLMTLMEQRGGTILAVEVLLLGAATVGAIGLDQYRQRR